MHKTKITVPDLLGRKSAGPKISVLTAYDATVARLLDEALVDVLLVGDSLGMVVQGQANTLGVTVDEICYHGRAVSRGTRRAHLVGDLPFMSFQGGPHKALESAGRLLKEGCFEAVKLEGGARYAEHVRLLVESGIPTMGHIGLLPQSVHAMGGFRVQGRDDSSAERILHDARILQEAGAYAVVLEGIPAELARRVTESIAIPTIGIGAGPHCDGQVLVCYDFLGMFSDIRPKFVKRFAELGQAVTEATRAYVAEVQNGSFPGAEHSFGAGPPRPRPKAEETYPRIEAAAAPASYGPASEDTV